MGEPGRPLSMRAALELVDIDAIASGEVPAPDLARRIIDHIATTFPEVANHNEAVTTAVLLGWRVRHELQLIREGR